MGCDLFARGRRSATRRPGAHLPCLRQAPTAGEADPAFPSLDPPLPERILLALLFPASGIPRRQVRRPGPSQRFLLWITPYLGPRSRVPRVGSAGLGRQGWTTIFGAVAVGTPPSRHGAHSLVPVSADLQQVREGASPPQSVPGLVLRRPDRHASTRRRPVSVRCGGGRQPHTAPTWLDHPCCDAPEPWSTLQPSSVGLRKDAAGESMMLR